MVAKSKKDKKNIISMIKKILVLFSINFITPLCGMTIVTCILFPEIPLLNIMIIGGLGIALGYLFSKIKNSKIWKKIWNI